MEVGLVGGPELFVLTNFTGQKEPGPLLKLKLKDINDRF